MSFLSPSRELSNLRVVMVTPKLAIDVLSVGDLGAA